MRGFRGLRAREHLEVLDVPRPARLQLRFSLLESIARRAQRFRCRVPRADRILLIVLKALERLGDRGVASPARRGALQVFLKAVSGLRENKHLALPDPNRPPEDISIETEPHRRIGRSFE